MKIQKVIFDSIDEMNEQLDADDRLTKLDNTILFGPGSKLDSMGLVNLVIAVEQNIEEEFGVIITIADERAMSQKNSPFRSVASLTNYIDMLLREKLDD